MVKNIRHAGFTVKNLDRSVAFYEKGLGLELMTRFDDKKDYHGPVLGYPDCHLRVAFLKVPDSPPIELIEYIHPAGASHSMETYNTGNGHLALVVDDVAETAEKLKKLGGTSRSREPVLVTSGPSKGAKVMFVRDPDGISIELFQPAGG